jgi:oligopeptide/dipeptide ABC transporter ATP-binding protein
MLDVSLRAGILRLMLRLREDRGVSVIFVTHDLSLAWVIAERIAVLYLGRIVEIGETETILGAALHPYTRALVSVIPVPERREGKRGTLLSGEAPSASHIPAGCRFRPRCPLYRELGEPAPCRDEDPMLQDVSAGNGAASHDVACHFVKRR